LWLIDVSRNLAPFLHYHIKSIKSQKSKTQSNSTIEFNFNSDTSSQVWVGTGFGLIVELKRCVFLATKNCDVGIDLVW
jgi:hypothetical protein